MPLSAANPVAAGAVFKILMAMDPGPAGLAAATHTGIQMGVQVARRAAIAGQVESNDVGRLTKETIACV